MLLAIVSVLPMQPRSPGMLAAVALAAAAAIMGYACGMRRIGWLPAISLAGTIGAAAVVWLTATAHGSASSVPEGLVNLRAELLEVWAGGGDAELFVWQFAWWALAWATPFVAGRAVAARGRAIDATALLGGLLIGLLLAVRSVDLWPAIAFAAAALLLHLEAAAADRRRRWARRSMTAADGVSASLVMRGWLATGATVLVAWALTSVAVGAPLDVAWQRLGDWWTTLGASSALPGSFGGGFAASFEINSRFDPSRQPVLRISGGEPGTYLRVTTHARYTGTGWEQDGSEAAEVAAGDPLHADGSLEALPANASRSTTAVRIILDRPMRELALPGRPVSLSLPARPVLSADGRSLVSVRAGTLESGAQYEVLAFLGAATAAELALAPDAYPEGLEAYLALDGVSERTIGEARRLASVAGTPYARAQALLDHLRSDLFRYSRQSFLPRPGSGQDVVDHFLFGEAGRRGFCEQFASSMVVMARAVGIPARLARGYVGGDALGDGTFQVRAEDRHAWAELYFPGHGWEVFEATPGIGSAADAGPSEGPNASTRPSSAATAQPSRPAEILPGRTDPGDGIAWAPMAVLAAMLIAMTVLAVARARRIVGPMPAARATLWWRAVDRAAGRVGLARAPSQTTYEHARELGRVMPRLDGDVHLLATAFVQEAYAGRTVERRAHGDLAGAWRRVARELRRLRFKRALTRPSHR